MDTSCGLGSFRPKWLNRFANIKSFMTVYGLLGTIQAMAYVYLVVTLTTMEKRFKIPSRTTGLILTGNEISQVLLSLVLSYHGAHRNRPRWIAWGVACSALSCFVVALPHLIYGPGNDALALTKEYLDIEILNNQNVSIPENELMCTAEKKKEICNEDTFMGDLSVVPLIMVFASQFIQGVGNTLYFALGQTYLDDNTKKTNTPVLLGWTMALRTLGPVIGFLLGYLCLNLYISPSMDPVIDKKDPRWLGAWWLGWILLGTVMMVFAVLVAMFPQHLPAKPSKNAKKAKIVEEQPLTSNNEKTTEAPVNIEVPTFKDFPAALKRLIRNKLLMCNNLAAIFYILGASGYITYISKYLEVQFQESATYTVVTGPASLIGMVAGFLISGYMISKYKPLPKFLLAWNVIVGFAFLFGEVAFMLLDCPINDLQNYSNDPNHLDLTSICNSNCSCTNIKYSPVCAPDTQTTYYSPCHAGCTTRLNHSKSYTNCACSLSNSSGLGEIAILKDGPCLTDCSFAFYIFVFLSFVINFMGSSGKIGNLLVNYRSVDIKDKSFAQGLALWMISLLALIPGPIIYGVIIDSTCLVWDETCNKRGNCWTYDRKKMRIYLNATALALTSMGVLFDAFVWYLGRTLQLYGQEQQEDNDRSVQKTDSKANVANNVGNNI